MSRGLPLYKSMKRLESAGARVPERSLDERIAF